MIGVSNNSGHELNVGGCHEMCLAVFTNLESLSRPLLQCESRFSLFNEVFSKAEIAKALRVTSSSVGKILDHLRIYGTAIPFYSHGDSQPSVQMNDNVSFINVSLGGRLDMIHKKISSIPTEYFQNIGRRQVMLLFSNRSKLNY